MAGERVETLVARTATLRFREAAAVQSSFVLSDNFFEHRFDPCESIKDR